MQRTVQCKWLTGKIERSICDTSHLNNYEVRDVLSIAVHNWIHIHGSICCNVFFWRVCSSPFELNHYNELHSLTLRVAQCLLQHVHVGGREGPKESLKTDLIKHMEKGQEVNVMIYEPFFIILSTFPCNFFFVDFCCCYIHVFLLETLNLLRKV